MADEGPAKHPHEAEAEEGLELAQAEQAEIDRLAEIERQHDLPQGSFTAALKPGARLSDTSIAITERLQPCYAHLVDLYEKSKAGTGAFGVATDGNPRISRSRSRERGLPLEPPVDNPEAILRRSRVNP